MDLIAWDCNALGTALSHPQIGVKVVLPQMEANLFGVRPTIACI
jgi:hypothetical protein